jgi:hypothetical protein
VAGARVILQLAAPVNFTDASRIAVPLKAPSVAESILVAAVIMTRGHAALRVTDNLAMLRWRQANADGGRALWYRLQSPHTAVTEVVIETANALKITGRAFVAECAGLNAGAAVQRLADLLLEFA